jgi:SAM-dependent methyltransferase
MTVPSPADASTWNQRYDGEDYVFGTEPNAYLRDRAAHWRPGSRLLCVADGEGRNSVWLAAQGMLVDAFDISEVGVAKARKLAAETGVSVEFSVSDCDAWPWPIEKYDGVVAIFVQFADPTVREHLFANVIRSLKVGGILVLLGYSPKQLEYKTGGPSQLSHLYSEDMLRAAFASTEILELRAFETDLAEGTRHCGQSALIGLVTRRI